MRAAAKPPSLNSAATRSAWALSVVLKSSASVQSASNVSSAPTDFGRPKGSTGTVVAAEREVVQVLAVLSEPPRQDGARHRLKPANRGKAKVSEGLRRHA